MSSAHGYAPSPRQCRTTAACAGRCFSGPGPSTSAPPSGSWQQASATYANATAGSPRMRSCARSWVACAVVSSPPAPARLITPWVPKSLSFVCDLSRHRNDPLAEQRIDCPAGWHGFRCRVHLPGCPPDMADELSIAASPPHSPGSWRTERGHGTNYDETASSGRMFKCVHIAVEPATTSVPSTPRTGSQGHGKVAFMQPEAGLACAAGRGRDGGWRRRCWRGRPGAGG